MTLSEVFYEAACKNTVVDLHGTWPAIVAVRDHTPDAERFVELMREPIGLLYSNIHDAARELGWTRQDYRTFMLLMASEAVK